MYLVLIAWLYVALMMAVAEATSPVGSLMGALFTFLLYGLLPMGVIGYIMGTPARRRARLAREMAERDGAAPQPASLASPDTGSETPRASVAPVRKEP
jgi:hypothetical protein